MSVETGSVDRVGRETLTERVYTNLLASICSSRLRPGSKLVIDALARDMSVSITPVREALRRLQREGLVTEVPYSGMFVSELSPDEIRELFALRGVLEGYAVSLTVELFEPPDLDALDYELRQLQVALEETDPSAFRRHNAAFHELLLGRCVGTKLRDMIDQLVRNTERYRAAAAVLDASYLEHAQREHVRIVDLVRRRRGVELEALLREHALTFARHLAEYVEREQREDRRG